MKVLEAGVGPYPAANSTVELHYQALLADGTVFDSSYARRDSTKLPLDGTMLGVREGAFYLLSFIRFRPSIDSISSFILFAQRQKIRIRSSF